MTKKHGVMYGVKKRRKRVQYFASEFERNMNAKVLSDLGYRVRKLKPKEKVV